MARIGWCTKSRRKLRAKSERFAVAEAPIRVAMVGGGPGALIGNAHRAAAAAGGFQLVAGAFSSNLDACRQMGETLSLDPQRCYGSWEAMIDAERARSDGAEAVIVITPNHLHAPVAKKALEAKLHVVCDKPLCLTVAEAEELVRLTQKNARVFGVTYTFAGFKAVKRAAEIVQSGEIGALRFVSGEFIQDWLTNLLETQGVKMAAWRMDPKRSGVAGTCADLGTHLWHLAEFITGERPVSLSAELATVVKGRELDDIAMVRLRYANGARGHLTATQATPASGGHAFIRIHGETGGLEWRVQAPNELKLFKPGGPSETLAVPTEGTIPTVAGAPPGYLWAFEDLYRGFAKAIREGGRAKPDVEDGLSGMKFIETSVRSSAQDGTWLPV
jgi:predicted dehydrogenase